MSNIEDKILDGPRIHYCDADDDDIRLEEESDRDFDSKNGRNDATSLFARPDEEQERLNRLDQISWQTGSSTNTGPKGVIEDYKKRSLKNAQDNITNDIDAEFQALYNDDSFIKEYISKRISNVNQSQNITFGQVYRLQTGSQLLDAIDNESSNVLVLVHIYTKYSRSCSNLNRCLDQLAVELKHIKFVTLDASVTGLSANFKDNGVPALLAYKKGDLIKSLVQLDEFLDRDFDSVQVKEILIENGLL